MKLKVTGILYIIGAILLLIGILALVAMGGLLAAADDGSGVGIVLAGIAGASIVPFICQAVLSLIIGVLGVKNCDRPEACGVNFTLGIVMIVWSVATGVINMLGNGIGTGLVGMIIGLIVPVIYTIGAKQNKDAA